jgi:hypothetical protein
MYPLHRVLLLKHYHCLWIDLFVIEGNDFAVAYTGCRNRVLAADNAAYQRP